MACTVIGCLFLRLECGVTVGFFFFFQAEDCIRGRNVTGVQTCALPISLDAPFVRIIGLFSNALEDPGVISSENGKWADLPDIQLVYLAAQLARIKKEKFPGAVLLAVHHPPFSYAPPPKKAGSGGNHGGSPNMLRQIDTICEAEGVYPHAVLSGHAHNYQRFERTLRFGSKEISVPFIVCGDGGHNVN